MSNKKLHTCHVCYEDKPFTEHAWCSNGHLAGCQRCHMNLIKSLYMKTDLRKSKVFGEHGESSCQACMFCRHKLYDYQMGINWQVKLEKLQPIMVTLSLRKIGCEPKWLQDYILSGKQKTEPTETCVIQIMEYVDERCDDVNNTCKYLREYMDINLESGHIYFQKKVEQLIIKYLGKDQINPFNKYLKAADLEDDDEVEVEEFVWKDVMYYKDDYGNLYKDHEIVGKVAHKLVTIF